MTPTARPPSACTSPKPVRWFNGRVLAIMLAAVWAVGASSLAWGQTPPVRFGPNLSAQLRYLDLRISSGRIHIASDRTNRSITATSRSNEMQERLTMNLAGESPTISYELVTPAHRIAIEISDGNRFSLVREPRGTSDDPPLFFEQPASGPMTLRVGGPDDARSVEANSLWLLLMLHPDGTSELAPLLEGLRGEWALAAQTDATRNAMFRNRETVLPSDLNRWHQLVNQLGSNSFSERELAERSLRDLGPVALPFLRNLDVAHLDTEQMFRVRRVLRMLENGAREDSAESVAIWLAADPRAWYAALLQSEDPTRGRIAAEQIAQLIGQPVEFDPQATGSQRRAQLDRIAAQIATFRPWAAPQRGP